MAHCFDFGPSRQAKSTPSDCPHPCFCGVENASLHAMFDRMKTMILALIALGLCARAQSISLSTTDGATYNHITAQRVDPDGLYIEYTLPGGGIGMSKVKFSRLSSEQQKQFGYEPAKAHEYESQVAKANEDFRQESL